jgi:hypothetical protein
MEIKPKIRDILEIGKTALPRDRKGFIYTLEAVIASMIFLGTIVTVVPELQQETTTVSIGDRMQSGLETLDRTGKLEDNLSVAELENDIRPYVPQGYEYEVLVREYGTETVSTSFTDAAPYTGNFINMTGYTEIQFWIESSNGMNAYWDGREIISNHDGKEYLLRQVDNNGTLKMNGTGSVIFSFNNATSRGNQPGEQNRIETVNYLIGGETPRQVSVLLWQ